MALGSRIIGAAFVGGSATYYANKTQNRLSLDSSSPLHPTTPTPKLSAYDKKEEPMYLIEEPPTALQKNIKLARKFTIQKIHQADAFMRGTVDHIIMFEQKTERTIKELKPVDEPLVPGTIYVGISTLFGSILSRNRAFPIRFLTPLALFITSAKLTLPKLSNNVGDFIYDQEARVPEMRKAHDEVRAQITKGLWTAGQTVEDLEGLLGEKVEMARSVMDRKTKL